MRGGVGVDASQPRKIRRVADDDHVVGILPAAADRELAIRFVRRDHHVGQREVDPLERTEAEVDRVAPAPEARPVQLRGEIVVVEQQRRSSASQRPDGGEEDVRGVRDVNDVKT